MNVMNTSTYTTYALSSTNAFSHPRRMLMASLRGNDDWETVVKASGPFKLEWVRHGFFYRFKPGLRICVKR